MYFSWLSWLDVTKIRVGYGSAPHNIRIRNIT